LIDDYQDFSEGAIDENTQDLRQKLSKYRTLKAFSKKLK